MQPSALRGASIASSASPSWMQLLPRDHPGCRSASPEFQFDARESAWTRVAGYAGSAGLRRGATAASRVAPCGACVHAPDVELWR